MHITKIALATTLIASSAYAQTGPCPTTAPTGVVLNPTYVCITASTDHNIIELGAPKVSEYRVQFYAPGVTPATGAPTQDFSVGKPTPNAQNAIWLQRAELGGIPIGQAYQATTVAVGPGGISPRFVSPDSFGRAGAPAPPVNLRLLTVPE